MSRQQRSFDWGPPSADWADFLKEWALYPVLFALIAVGGWLLFIPDTGRPGKASPSGRQSGMLASVDNRCEDVLAPPPASSPVPPPRFATGLTIPSQEPTPPVAPPTFPSYVVQVGAFGDEESARDTMARIREAGFETTLSEPSEPFDMFRLLMGPYSSESEAETIARQLNAFEFYAFVIESP